MLSEFQELWLRISPTNHEVINCWNKKEKSWNGHEQRGDIVKGGVERGIQHNVEYREALSKIVLYQHSDDHINLRYTSHFEYSQVVRGCFAATVHDSGSDWWDSECRAFEWRCGSTCVLEGEELYKWCTSKLLFLGVKGHIHNGHIRPVRAWSTNFTPHLMASKCLCTPVLFSFSNYSSNVDIRESKYLLYISKHFMDKP